MRRLPLHRLPSIVLLSVSLVFIQGCARPILQTYPASRHDIELATEAFLRHQKLHAEVCSCCLDAEADTALSVSGWFRDHTGKLSGYLQAMEPGYIKFVALNPLGQPLFILVTNGKTFKSLNVIEAKAYMGSVHSETFKRFTPFGFEPEYSYYWLTGRLPPGDMQIKKVMRDRQQQKFWLQINHSDSSMDSMVLFDPESMVIMRHVLRDERGDHLLDIHYSDYLQFAENLSSPVSEVDRELCRIPAGITVSSKGGSEKIELKLHSFFSEANFSAADFQQDIPDNFEQLIVK